jgi:hypothetical protein
VLSTRARDLNGFLDKMIFRLPSSRFKRPLARRDEYRQGREDLAKVLTFGDREALSWQ